jgi:hypothetical protein
LINHPFQRGAVAEAVVVGFFGNAGEGEEVVVNERLFVFAQAHFVHAQVELFAGLLTALQRIFFLLLVIHVQLGQALAGSSEGVEARGIRDPRQFALEVGGVARTVLRVMQYGVGVVEDVPFGDGFVFVVGAELLKRPVGDVLAAVSAVFRVSIEGEALGAALWTA